MELKAYVWRLQHALGLSKDEYIHTPFDVLEQFAYAAGEALVLERIHHAESVAIAISASLGEAEAFEQYADSQIDRVQRRRPLSKDDLLKLNQQALNRLRNE